MDGSAKVAAKVTTLDDIEAQAGNLIQDLANVSNRIENVYGVMNGAQPAASPCEEECRAAGSIGEISRRLRASDDLVTSIKNTLAEIESVVLSDKALACKDQ